MFDTSKIVLTTILAHKLRSFLTLLGLIISISSFILILSILLGFNIYVDEKISKIGRYTFEVNRFSLEDFRSEKAIEYAQKRNKYLKIEELEYLRTNANLTEYIGAKVSPSAAEIKRGSDKLSDISIIGTDPIISVIEELDIAEGRYFDEPENNSRVKVAFIGKGIANELFPYSSPLNKVIHINNLPYRVIGVQKEEGNIMGEAQDNFIIIPLKTYSSQFGRATIEVGLTFIGKAKSKELFDSAVEEIRLLLRVKRNLSSEQNDNFGIHTPEALAKLRENILGTIFVVIMIVPTIALLVGAIVIMNTMLASITERTKEIGLRRASGATKTDIMNQFLMESTILAIIGGSIGVIVASVLRNFVLYFGFPTIIPWWAILTSIIISGLVGFLAGYLPARKAAELDPIQALQTE